MNKEAQSGGYPEDAINRADEMMKAVIQSMGIRRDDTQAPNSAFLAANQADYLIEFHRRLVEYYAGLKTEERADNE